MSVTLKWQVHTRGLFEEITNGSNTNGVFKIPLNIMLGVLREVAQRATELNDPKMNELMVRLSLYSVANPDDPEYNPELVSKILGEK
jgi:hypothetical protein